MSTKGTILIMDDETHVLYFMSQVFNPMGYGTLTAQSGESALNYLESCQGKIDLVLADLGLPGIDGVEVIRQIRAKDTNLPILVLSANTHRKEECEMLGIEGFVAKPYSLEDLRDQIEVILEQREKLRETEEDIQVDPTLQPCAKILLVDDEPDACEVLSEVLFELAEGAKFTVKWAQSGPDALELSEEFQPDIGIIDIKMPEMSGDELIRRFKSGEGYCPRDFVIYTGVTDKDTLTQVKDLGHKVLEKPADIDTLFDVLKRTCYRNNLVKRVD